MPSRRARSSRCSGCSADPPGASPAQDRLNSVRFEPDCLVKVDGQLERVPRVFVSYVRRPYRLRKETPVLCLDGTGSLSLNRKIFGDHMTAERFAVPRDAEVYQVSSKTFSRQSITGTNRDGTPRSNRNVTEAASLRAQVVEFLDMLPGNVLLVSYKAAIEALIDDLPRTSRLRISVPCVGSMPSSIARPSSSWAASSPPPKRSRRLTRPFTATDPEPFLPVGEYVLQTRGRRMRDPMHPTSPRRRFTSIPAANPCWSRSARPRWSRQSTAYDRSSTAGRCSC